jgi:Cytochrome C'
MSGFGSFLRKGIVFGVGVACLACSHHSLGQAPAAREYRAKRPDWEGKDSPVIVSDETELDALLLRLNKRQAGRPNTPTQPSSAGKEPQVVVPSWMAWTSRESLESEVKVELRNLQGLLQKSSEFSASSHRETKHCFARLAMLFAFIADFPEEIRWKSSAAAASHHFHQIFQKLRGGSPADYKLAQEGRDSLRELLDGGSPNFDTIKNRSTQSQCVVERVSVMQKLEALTENSMGGFLSSAREFSKHRKEFTQDAEIVGMLAVLLAFKGVEGTDDSDYLNFVRTFQAEVGELVKIAREGDYEQSRLQLGKVNQVCTTCHEEYR